MPSQISAFFSKHGSANWFWIACILLGAFLIMLPLPLLGIPDGFDTPEHLRFVETYRRALEAGVFMPAWGAADNYGFGSVGVRFYPPLAHYVMAAVQELTRDWYWTVLVTSFFWMFTGVVGIYYWSREFMIESRSALAALLFATLPYHLMQLYVYMLLAEFAAIAVLPYCFLFATRVIRRGRTIDVLCFAAAYSALILTHLPSIIIGSIALAIYCLSLLDRQHLKRTIIGFVSAGIAALSLTAFYLVRLINELQWVKHNDPQFFANSIYDYRQYLFPMILNPEKPFWKKMVFLVDIPIFLTFLFLLPPIACLLIKAVRERTGHSQKKVLIALTATGVFLIFILSYPSVFVWDNISVLQKVQFPFRFLSAASVIAAPATALSFFLFRDAFPRRQKLIGYILFSLVFVTGLFSLTQIIIPSEADQRERFDQKIAEAHEDAGCRCWWPTWADSRAFNDRTKGSAAGRVVTVDDWSDVRRQFSVNSGEPANLRIATFWYPYWHVSVNGKEAESGADQFGAVLVPLPADSSIVQLEFREPAVVKAARIVSLVCWLCAVALLVFLSIGKKKLNGL